MKILAFTDIHADPSSFKILRKKVEKENPDLVVCCGDISNFGIDLDFAVKQILLLNRKTLLIPGNHETEKEIQQISERNEKIINLHNHFFEHNDLVFYGYGTGGFTRIDEKFERMISSVIKKIPKKKKLIFVTHAPLYNTLLDKLPAGHHGNKTTRKFVEITKPILVLSGHFHENEKKEDKIGNSRIINPGHDGTIIEL